MTRSILCRGGVLLLLLGLAPALLQAQERGISVSQGSPPRVALVIGNGSYRDAPLKNPVNDSRQMTAALRRSGFRVIEGTDLSHAQMEERIREFGLALRSGAVGLFYFAGHGIQVGGSNYLVPVDADITKESEVKFKTVDLGFVLAQMEDAQNGLNLVVLDACRNNPFARSWRSASRGLAQVSAPTGTLIAYATAPGSVASDGDGANGLYTQELLRFIEVPGLPVEEVFKQVRIAVRKRSGGSQTPWEASSIMGHFSFRGAPSAPDPMPVRPPVAPVASDSGGASGIESPERGQALLGEKRYAEAESHLRAAVRASPTSPRNNNELGIALFGQQKYSEAERYFREAVRLDPSTAAHNHNLGDALRAQKRPAEAEPHLREAVRLEPTSARYQNQLGLVTHLQQKYSEAERYFREAARLEPGNPSYHHNLGDALRLQQKAADAEPHLREAVRLEPTSARYQNQLGIVTFMQRKYSEAERYFREAVRLEPSNASYNHNVGDALRLQQRPADAEPYFREAVRLAPSNARYNQQLGAVQKILGRT